MKVLFVVWEIAPFFKVGGLGDIARSLPAALKELGVEICVVTPYYKAVKFGRVRKKFLGKFAFDFADKKETVEVYQVFHPLAGFPVFFLKSKSYLNVVKKNDTWGFFDKAVVEAVKGGVFPFYPQVIHCNDLHAGLIPLLVKEEKLKIKTMLTIHNLAHQGKTGKEILYKLGLGEAKSKLLTWEIKSKQINLLMESIIHADVITTVSPTYAREIMTEEYGMGLDEVLQGKEGRVFGILNGINVEGKFFYHNDGKVCRFVEEKITKNSNFFQSFDLFLERKKKNKAFLQKKLGLKISSKIPLSCFVGRFDPNQKGLEILHRMLRRLDLEKHQFVLLGSGNVEWEERFEWFNKFYPRSVSCNFTFDECLAHEIYEASDFILIPSKFEPCGLIQMLAMFFGTLPIARKTGGLADSIKNNFNGFLFEKYSSKSLEYAYKKAVNIWQNDREAYKTMVLAALKVDFSWRKSAREYLGLYEKLTEGKL